MLLKNRYELIKKLGEGTYGDVFLAKDTHNDDKLVAVKRQRPDVLLYRREGYNVTALREITVLKELGSGASKHPNIVELVDVFQLADGAPCIVIEFLQKGSLQNLLSAGDPSIQAELQNQGKSVQEQVLLTPSHIKNLAFQILAGLHHLHSNFMLHRDLKPDNLMLTRDGTLKFIDFGMAKRFEEEVPLSKNQITFVYRPPEILFGAAYYGPSADIWSAGCILAELLIKRPLFPGSTFIDQLSRIFSIRGTPDNDPEWKNVRILSNFKRFTPTAPKPWKELFPNESEAYLDLLDKMLQLNPNKRISAQEALQHPYFTEEEPKACQNSELPI